jgi:hypothetical protein
VTSWAPAPSIIAPIFVMVAMFRAVPASSVARLTAAHRRLSATPLAHHIGDPPIERQCLLYPPLLEQRAQLREVFRGWKQHEQESGRIVRDFGQRICQNGGNDVSPLHHDNSALDAISLEQGSFDLLCVDSSWCLGHTENHVPAVEERTDVSVAQASIQPTQVHHRDPVPRADIDPRSSATRLSFIFMSVVDPSMWRAMRATSA